MSKSAELITSIEANIERIATLTDAAAQSQELKRFLQSAARFHSYSFANQMLIAMQRPAAERVAGFHTWQTFGRHVKKGAKGIHILAPIVAAKKDDPEGQKDVLGFRSVCVFDVADTEGDPLPDCPEYRIRGNADAILTRLLTAAESLGVSVRFESIREGARGYSTGGKVAIESEVSTSEQAGTLAHELAHEVLHWVEANDKGKRKLTDRPREQKELEAEAVSYVVMFHLGIDQPSQFYLAGWSATAEAIRQSLSVIRNGAKRIIDALPNNTVESMPIAA